MPSHKIIFIGGTHSCGSTLLSRLLGECTGVVDVGELLRVLAREDGTLDKVNCSCNGTLKTCYLLQKIQENERLRTQARKYLRIRNIMRLCLLRTIRDEEYHDFLQELSRFLNEICGENDVLVEDSKYPPAAVVLSHVPNFSTKLIHLTRNPVQSFASWKQKNVSHCFTKGVFMWNFNNFVNELVGGFSKNYKRIRYEDLVAEPKECVESILGFALPDHEVDCDFISGCTAWLSKSQHHLQGNNARSQQGKIQLKRREYDLNAVWRILVSVVTFPLQWHYNYLRPLSRKNKGSSQS